MSASKLRAHHERDAEHGCQHECAICGVLKRGWTFAIVSKNSPSSAIAKNTRGDASMLPLSELNEEIITKIETRTTPARAEERHASVSAATEVCAGRRWR